MIANLSRRRVLSGLIGASCAAPMLAGSAPRALASEPDLLRIGTAGVSGVYSAIGNGLCRLLEPDLVRRRQNCEAVITDGSVNNIRFIRSGLIDIGIAQADLLRRAYNGTETFAGDGANLDLRVLFSPVVETVLFVISGDSDLQAAEDLLGRRIDLGSPGSGERATLEGLMEAGGFGYDDFAAVTGRPSAQRGFALCEGGIDGFVFVAANPNLVVQDALSTCDSSVVGLAESSLPQFVEQSPEYRLVTLSAGTYERQSADLATLGVPTFVFADRNLPVEMAKRVTQAVFEGLDEFRRLHLSFSGLDETALLAPCPGVPYHDGALAYFAEAGIEAPLCN